MGALESYKRLVRDYIGKRLTERGFSRRGFLFKKPENGNLALIDFQRSDNSTEAAVPFTVNLGVRYDRISSVLSPAEMEQTPNIGQCQWTARLGEFLADHRDRWWLMRVQAEAESLATEVFEALRTHFLDNLGLFSRDEWVRDLWLSGVSPGLTKQQRLMNLSVLLKIIGPGELLSPTIEELRTIAAGFLVDNLVRKLDRLG